MFHRPSSWLILTILIVIVIARRVSVGSLDAAKATVVGRVRRGKAGIERENSGTGIVRAEQACVVAAAGKCSYEIRRQTRVYSWSRRRASRHLPKRRIERYFRQSSPGPSRSQM